ncbi:MAG: leucine--tRNA ligase, partial [Bacteroidia bacterium]|nr:leucine--tRNA ligase [Bacteroidia bacterium]
MEYNFKEIEANWQKFWADNKTFAAKDDSAKEKYYVLDMFPYPSGAGLHVGHPLGYIASDIVARFKRHKGFNVLHPMGYDSFGLPAEQYAIQTGQHPKITTENNIAVYRKQLDKIGFSFDWDREVRTSNPDYYKWTQWIFIQLFNSWYNKSTNKAEPISNLISEFEVHGNANIQAHCDDDVKSFTAEQWKAFTEKEQSDVVMAYRMAYLGEAYVNWCPQLGTVLANDEIKDGLSERGGYPVERKLMKQWSMRITAYAQRLLDGLDTLDWTDSLKEAQRNWIGKSEGTSLKFKVANSTLDIEVFTTRPDTIFGVSFVTLAPEHELVNSLTTPENKLAVDAYVTQAKNRSERERQADINKITGVPTGSFVEHPFSGKQIPIWIGDYVLAGYGTGAVMAVPAHDSRDYSFAKQFGLPILEVVAGGDLEKESYDAKEGTLINSDFLNGLDVKAAMKKAISQIEANGLGKGKVNFRLRDAVFGRQRYWGEPIPIYYKNDIPYALSDSELPLVLPEVDKYLPTEDGEPPLARAKDWKYQNEFDYEHSTMPGWAGSSWYFLRYMDPHNGLAFADKKLADYWKQVDLYIGGSEHATGHLLYVRFWTKILNDLGHIAIDEPAKKLINQGMIQGTSAYTNIISKINFINLPNEVNKHFLIYVSKNKLKEFISTNNTSFIKDIYQKHYVSIDFSKTNFEFDKQSSNNGVGKRAVLVDYINPNDTLQFDNFKEWRDVIYKEAGLIVEYVFEDDGSFVVEREVEKMSKSKWNVVTPDDIAEKFGSDTLRLYEMFLGPLEQSKPWNTNGITGVHGFLKKLWRLFYQNDAFTITHDEPTKAELKTVHKTIKKITEDIERFSFNTSVSNFMICVNELTDLKCNKKEILEPLLICLSPYAPHITEELWKQLGHTESIAFAPFPLVNEAFLIDDSINYPVSVNGKLKFTLELPATLTKEEVEEEVMKNEQTIKLLAGQQPKKVIV